MSLRRSTSATCLDQLASAISADPPGTTIAREPGHGNSLVRVFFHNECEGHTDGPARTNHRDTTAVAPSATPNTRGIKPKAPRRPPPAAALRAAASSAKTP